MNNRLPSSKPQQAIISTPRHRLHQLFRPDSVAVFGVSEEPGSLGWRIFENLQQSSFTGRVAAINPALSTVFGHPCHPDVSALPKAPDLAVLALPYGDVAQQLPALAAAGTRHVVWLLDFDGETPPEVARKTAAQARALGINLLGADSLGLAHPSVRLNLLASDVQVKAGGVAVISQSSAICSALLDFAQGNGIGLASVVDTGTESDIDLADLLDYLTFDGNARSIAMFVGGIRNPRRFLGALRAAARTKPVVILRVSRHEKHSTIGQPRARLTHAENMASNDRTLLSALERSGAVIVDSFGELFATLEWLNDNKNVQGNRLAIVSNGGGLALLANDACYRHGVKVAQLQDDTLNKLTLPVTASSSLYRYNHSSPYTPGNQTITEQRMPMVNLGVACTPALAAQTLRTVVADRQADAVLGVFHSTLVCDASSLATEILGGKLPSPMLLALVGEADSRRGAEMLNAKGVSVFRTPEDAVRAFSVLAQYQRGQQRLLETPGPSRDAEHFDESRIATLLARAREAGDTMLNQMASNEVLAACGIPVPRTEIASDAEEAVRLAAEIGYPVVMKLQSRDVLHKSDVGGVWLDIRSEEELRNAARTMSNRLESMDPQPRLDGFVLQPMIPRQHSREVLIGASHDPAFGPIIHFGAGGVTVELIDDTALALPPLNQPLARELINKTRIAKLLKSHHGVPAADIEGIVDVLLAVSALLTRFPAVHALDINPLLVSPAGVIALDARIRLDPAAAPLDTRYSHLAIHPYPVEAERRFMAKAPRPAAPAVPGPPTGSAPVPETPAVEAEPVPPTPMLMRPIRPDDAARLSVFFDGLSAETRLWRFLHPIRVMSPQMVARFTQVDYDRDMALVAVEEDKGPDAPLIGVARYIREPNESRCEFAVVVSDDWQGRGVAKVLMEHLIELARANGLDTMIGLVHGNNMKMLSFMRRLGFQITKDPDEPELRQTTLYIEPLPTATETGPAEGATPPPPPGGQ